MHTLLHLPRLADLALISWESLSVDDGFIAEIAHAWPVFEALHIRPTHENLLRSIHLTSDNAVTPSVTLTGLLPLARHCPALRLVILSIATDVDLPSPDFSTPPPPSPLSTLYVGMAVPPRDPLRLAVFLSAHFPMVTGVGFYPKPGEDIFETNMGWFMVESLLDHFSLIREQEREWAERSRRSQGETQTGW
ncbi:hypothetical protein L227DRAFT_581912 [Lentinus tigrinus ALCF2SS1-6]|uniref:F-box domain-containing protein n=1 Tax=Lentinus tigrinus ALCF2SS1-6 TaxID=1328759 RepID=A0A5C2RNV1_9APHY|nr:hypothetical protein L227DRAFT_581912 [Lentinus tigrinus ALCF2SS1-6]